MALTNAERQKRYREARKNNTSELEKLRNENKELRAENEKLRALRKKSRKQFELLDENDAFFYIDNGELQLLQWPETPGTLKTRQIEIIPYIKIDKKYKKQIDQLITEYNAQAEKLNFENFS